MSTCTLPEAGTEDRAARVGGCIGCGYCCFHRPCGVSSQLFRDAGAPCSALTWHRRRKRYICGCTYITSHPEYRERAAIGTGCDFPENPWRLDLRERTPEGGSYI